MCAADQSSQPRTKAPRGGRSGPPWQTLGVGIYIPGKCARFFGSDTLGDPALPRGVLLLPTGSGGAARLRRMYSGATESIRPTPSAIGNRFEPRGFLFGRPIRARRQRAVTQLEPFLTQSIFAK